DAELERRLDERFDADLDLAFEDGLGGHLQGDADADLGRRLGGVGGPAGKDGADDVDDDADDGLDRLEQELADGASALAGGRARRAAVVRVVSDRALGPAHRADATEPRRALVVA